ncbi:MAG TPA: hypothetical protein O0X01_08075 [Methanocorpusculum sp.]|nr:hypothetical protein [Methanocorpusculum sp.]
MKLGISKQAVSKMEQKHFLDDARLKRVAAALNVSDEGVRHFSESTILPLVNRVLQEAVPPGITSPAGFLLPSAAPTPSADPTPTAVSTPTAAASPSGTPASSGVPTTGISSAINATTALRTPSMLLRTLQLY